MNASNFFRHFLLTRSLQAAFLLLPTLIKPRRLATILRSILYFRPGPDNHDDPEAEMLSFLVESQAQGGGVATKLFWALVDEFRRRGVHEIKFGTVAGDNTKAIRFYEKLGCERVRTEEFYRGSTIHIYVYRDPGRRAPDDGAVDGSASVPSSWSREAGDS